MLPNNEETLRFLREFERSSVEYLRERGVDGHEVANAQLDMQWKLLHTILSRHPLPSTPRKPVKQHRLEPRTSRATIA